MTGDPSDFDPQRLWQSQQKELDPMALAEIHAKARKFESRIQRRNAIEYVACGVVMVGFTPALLNSANWMIQAGAGLIMLGTLVVAWQLHRRASAVATPNVGEALVDSYRRQLVRQRDAIRSVGAWYLAPLIPGLALMLIGFWFRGPARPGQSLAQYHLGMAIMDAVMVVLFAGVWALNRRGARVLQKRIDALGPEPRD